MSLKVSFFASVSLTDNPSLFLRLRDAGMGEEEDIRGIRTKNKRTYGQELQIKKNERASMDLRERERETERESECVCV